MQFTFQVKGSFGTDLYVLTRKKLVLAEELFIYIFIFLSNLTGEGIFLEVYITSEYNALLEHATLTLNTYFSMVCSSPMTNGLDPTSVFFLSKYVYIIYWKKHKRHCWKFASLILQGCSLSGALYSTVTPFLG